MTTDPLAMISTRTTSQMRQADPAQEKNSEGAYTFVADDMSRLRRFLATGAEGGTFYASAKDVAVESGNLVINLIRTRPREVLDTVVDMSVRGATVRQHPLMFTMAALSGAPDVAVRREAIAALPQVARTASMLFLFVSYVKNFRGWGKGLRKGIARWYDDMDIDRLAYQIEKYGQRFGYSHYDVLTLGHVGSTQSGSTLTPERAALYAHAAGKNVDGYGLPAITNQAVRLRECETPGEAVEVIESIDGGRVSWEMVKSEHLAKPEVWQALLDGNHVPIGALIRNLGQLTAKGVLDPMGVDDRTARIVGRLTDPSVLTKGRVHPMSVLLAACVYASGRGINGDLTWHPIPNLNKALDMAFAASFGSIVPESGPRVMIGVDVSKSMDTNSVAGLPLPARTAAVALAQALAGQFPRNMGLAFTGNSNQPGVRYMSDLTSSVTPFDVDPGRRLTDLVREAQGFEFGRTDCAQPVLYAMEKGLAVDAFVILTDNETWAGKIHPHQALRQYRERTGIPARMVSVAMQNNPSTIADPKDPLMLDVVGLDSNVVSLVGDFIAGRV